MLKHLMGSESAPVSPRHGQTPFDYSVDPQHGIEPGQSIQLPKQKPSPIVFQPAGLMKGTAAELVARNEQKRPQQASREALEARNAAKRTKKFLARDDAFDESQ